MPILPGNGSDASPVTTALGLPQGEIGDDGMDAAATTMPHKSSPGRLVASKSPTIRESLFANRRLYGDSLKMTEVSTAAGNRRLGRGLSALLGGGAPAHEEAEQTLLSNSELRHIPIDDLSRNPFQPRQQFDPESLGELASSIKEHGVLQPVIVRELENGFQLIAGERRWQAAKKAGLTAIPCRIVDVIDKTACEFALEENLKRKDLNDLEKAQAFRDYINQFECTIEELSRQLSMSRSAVSNMLRLLELPDPVKNALHAGRITAGHARSLLPLEQADQLALCGRIQAESLSVRQTEAAVKSLLNPPHAGAEGDASPAASAPEGEATASTGGTPQLSPESEEHPQTLPLADAERTNHITSLEQQLHDLLGVKVHIKLDSKESGQIVIPFASNDEFERILKTVRRAAA